MTLFFLLCLPEEESAVHEMFQEKKKVPRPGVEPGAPG